MSNRTILWIAIVLLFVVFLVGTARDAYSEAPNCGPMKKISSGLSNLHGETPRAFAKLDEGGSPIIIFVNPTSGTWTIIMLMSDDIGCIVTSGTNWKESLQSKGKAL